MKKVTTLLAAGLAAAVGAANAAETITVVSWGGAYTKSQIEAYHKPWMAATGNTVVSEDYNGGLSEVKAQVEAGNVKWDLIDVELSDAVRGCDEGLLEEVSIDDFPDGADGTPAKDDFLPGTYTDLSLIHI